MLLAKAANTKLTPLIESRRESAWGNAESGTEKRHQHISLEIWYDKVKDFFREMSPQVFKIMRIMQSRWFEWSFARTFSSSENPRSSWLFLALDRAHEFKWSLMGLDKPAGLFFADYDARKKKLIPEITRKQAPKISLENRQGTGKDRRSNERASR